MLTPRCTPAVIIMGVSPSTAQMVRVASATWKTLAMQAAEKDCQNLHCQAHRTHRVHMTRMAQEAM